MGLKIYIYLRSLRVESCTQGEGQFLGSFQGVGGGGGRNFWRKTHKGIIVVRALGREIQGIETLPPRYIDKERIKKKNEK